MRRLAVAMVAALIACLALAMPAWAHRFYASLAEVEYDAERSTIEVSLRIDDHNLEDALRLDRGRDYRLTIDPDGEKAARDYIASHFVIQPPEGRALGLEWVGWEWSPGIAWLHFEFKVAGDPTELHLTNTLFLDLSDQQVNTVNVRWGEHRHTLTFGHKTRGQGLGLPSEGQPWISN